MDKIPVYHAMDLKLTIDHVGAHLVNLVCTSASDTVHVTVAVTVTSSACHIKLMVVFKGKQTNRYFYSL